MAIDTKTPSPYLVSEGSADIGEGVFGVAEDGVMYFASLEQRRSATSA
jgi:hypothetical protein